MEKKYYIKEFSETFGISTATLRYYEKIGLVCSKRDQNNLFFPPPALLFSAALSDHGDFDLFLFIIYDGNIHKPDPGSFPRRDYITFAVRITRFIVIVKSAQAF